MAFGRISRPRGLAAALARRETLFGKQILAFEKKVKEAEGIDERTRSDILGGLQHPGILAGYNQGAGEFNNLMSFFRHFLHNYNHKNR